MNDRERSGRRGDGSSDLPRVAKIVVRTCGLGTVLDVGSGEGVLVRELLEIGVDANGIDISDCFVARANKRAPGRFRTGNILALPFTDGAFETVVSTHCLEHIASNDVPTALRELWRVAGRFVLLQLATTQGADNNSHLTVQGRAWWERQCFAAGFRKHPAYYEINRYEDLEYDDWQILIPLEKIAQAALDVYPLEALDEERGLHMDMTRETGDRSDAHIIRYQLAASYARPGDRILDAACGLGYGSHVLSSLTRSSRVVGIDASDYAVDYATRFFGDGDKVSFSGGVLPDALAGFEPNSFDLIVSFETLEHVKNPSELLAAFQRVLTPGGRIVVSVPNNWSDESGEDPNPYHLQVYTWDKLSAQIAAHFVLESAYQQVATQCKIKAAGHRWELRPRTLRKVDLSTPAHLDSEWWVTVGMKPSEAEPGDLPAESTSSPGMVYENPWIERALVHFGQRLSNPGALRALGEHVLAVANPSSNDYFAALAVLAYQTLCDESIEQAEVDLMIAALRGALLALPSGPAGIRWHVSLLFVMARLEQKLGRLDNALEIFETCGGVNPFEFSVHLATKTTEALFWAGLLAYSAGNPERARANWQKAVAFGSRLLATKLSDVVVDCNSPNLFDHGDGIREYIVAWDFIARSANAIHLLSTQGSIRAGQFGTLFNSFTYKHEVLLSDLLATRHVLAERGRELEERTILLRETQQAVSDRTAELVATRETLVERTELFRRTSEDLQGCTAELVAARQTLVDRTELLQGASDDLQSRTVELVAARKTLADRTELLQRTSDDLQSRTVELVAARETLADRTELLQRTSDDLQSRTVELVAARETLADRTELLQRTSDDLQSRTAELVAARETLADRTEMLQRTSDDLQSRTVELVAARETLADRTELLQRTSDDLQSRTVELATARKMLAERTELLNALERSRLYRWMRAAGLIGR